MNFKACRFTKLLAAKCIYVVESPFQLMCMFSYVSEDDFIIFRPTSKSSEAQLLVLMRLYNIGEEYNYSFLKFKNRLTSLVSIFLVYSSFILKRNDSWHFGYFRSRASKAILATFSNKKIYYYDDGMATFSILNADLLERYPNIVFRTIFQKSLTRFPRVEYNSTNLGVSNLKKRMDSRRVFLGTKLVEAEFLDVKEYTCFVKHSIDNFKVDLYVAHRDESKEKLEVIRNLGIDVIKLDVPVELAIRTGEISIDLIVGTVSSALLTSKLLFDIEVYYYSASKITRRRKARIENIEREYDANDVVRVYL